MEYKTVFFFICFEEKFIPILAEYTTYIVIICAFCSSRICLFYGKYCDDLV